jgi:hypothetical protein
MPFRASWDKKKHGPKSGSIDRIKFQRLDTYFTQNNLKGLDLLKIDVDGYELRVINGGKETITKHKPIILIELGVTVDRIGDKLEVLVETISSFGYTIYSIESSGIEKFHGKELLIETIKQKRAMDCLCLPT